MSESPPKILGRSFEASQKISTASREGSTLAQLARQEGLPSSEATELTYRKELLKQEHLQEICLMQARALQFVFDVAIENPHITKQELIDLLKNSADVVQPRFLEQLAETVTTCAASIESLRREVIHDDTEIQDNQRFTEEVFTSLVTPAYVTKKGLSSEDVLSLTKLPHTVVFTSFGLILHVYNEEAFSILWQPPIAGVVIASHTLTYKARQSQNEKTLILPITVISGQNQTMVIDHEQAHSEYNALVDTQKILDVEKKSSSSSETKVAAEMVVSQETDVTSLTAELAQLVELLRSDPNNIYSVRKQPAFLAAITYALHRAKDEYIADMKPKEGDANGRYNILTDEFGPYNFFSSALKVGSRTPLMTELWDVYAPLLEEYTASARSLYRFYSSDSTWAQRKELFRLVLVQFPIDQWESQLDRLGFMRERELATCAEAASFAFNMELSALNGLTDEHLIYQKFFRPHLQRFDQISEENTHAITKNQSYSRLSVLSQSKEKVRAVQNEIRQTPEYRFLNRLQAFRNMAHEIENNIHELSNSIPRNFANIQELDHQLQILIQKLNQTVKFSADSTQMEAALIPIVEEILPLHQKCKSIADAITTMQNAELLAEEKAAEWSITLPRKERHIRESIFFAHLRKLEDSFYDRIKDLPDSEGLIPEVAKFVSEVESYLDTAG